MRQRGAAGAYVDPLDPHYFEVKPFRVPGKNPPGFCHSFFPLIFSEGVFYVGYGGDLGRALACGEFRPPEEYDFQKTGSSTPNVMFVSNYLSDALTVAKLWRTGADSGVVVFDSRVFNGLEAEGNAGVGALEAVNFKYPYITKPVPVEDATLIIVNQEVKGTFDRILAGGQEGGYPPELADRLRHYRETGVYGRIVAVELDLANIEALSRSGRLYEPVERLLKERGLEPAKYVKKEGA